MQKLTQKDLALLDEVSPGYKIQLVETDLEGTRWWRMEVMNYRQEKIYEVATALGKTKIWSCLDTAASFIKKNCPATQKFQIVFDSSTK